MLCLLSVLVTDWRLFDCHNSENAANCSVLREAVGVIPTMHENRQRRKALAVRSLEQSLRLEMVLVSSCSSNTWRDATYITFSTTRESTDQGSLSGLVTR